MRVANDVDAKIEDRRIFNSASYITNIFYKLIQIKRSIKGDGSLKAEGRQHIEASCRNIYSITFTPFSLRNELH